MAEGSIRQTLKQVRRNLRKVKQEVVGLSQFRQDRLDYLADTTKNSNLSVIALNTALLTYYFGREAIKTLLKQEDEIPAAVLPEYEDLAFRLAARPVSPATSQDDYRQWQAHNAPRPVDLQQMRQLSKILPYQPLISIVVPVYNTPADFLKEAIDSVRAQIYPHWELCIADDASTQPHIRLTLEEYTQLDDRIKVIYREQNGHISNNSNSALTLATGEFIALLDHDDLLTPEALFQAVLVLNQDPDLDLIYSDEDKIDEQGYLLSPYFKPDWCPDSLLSRMYICHLSLYRHTLIKQIGGFRVGYEGAQDYDLALRFTERTDRIHHIPRILYHWRMHPQSTAKTRSSKSYVNEAGYKALVDALERRQEPGRVLPTQGGHWIVRYDLKRSGKVTVVIPTRDLGSVLDTCLKSIFTKTSYENFEVLVIDNGSKEKETQIVFESWLKQEPDRFRCLTLDIPFNFSRINNYAVDNSEGEYILLLNNDTEVIESDWMTAMVEQAQRPSIGAVGAMLLFPDNTIQHAGIVLGIGGFAGHSHKYMSADTAGYYFQPQTINNYSAVTGACLMCRRETFLEVGGLDERFTVALNDVDFCLKLQASGYRNLSLPHVRLYHYESKSRGYEITPEKAQRLAKETDLLKEKWGDLLQKDPCYSPNLTRHTEDYRIIAS